MAQVVDTLVTKFTLDNSSYNAAADKVVAKTQAVGAKMTRALAVKPPPVMGSGKVGGAGGGAGLAAMNAGSLTAVGSAVGAGLIGAAVILGAATAKFIEAQIDFAGKAYQAYAKLDPVAGGALKKLEETANQATLVFGSVVSEKLTPIVQAITDSLDTLIKDGTIEKVATSFVSLFDAVSVKDLPNIMRNLANTAIGVNQALGKLGSAAAKVFDMVTPWWVKKAGAATGNKLRGDGEQVAVTSGKANANVLKLQDDQKKAKEREKLLEKQAKEEERTNAKLAREQESKAKEDERKREMAQRINVMNAQARYLANIAANTSRMVDLQEMIVGGGSLAAMGIAANDLSLYRRSRNRPPATDPYLAQLGLFVQTQTLSTMGGVR